ncbi:MAG: glucokinase [Nitrospirae bacterium]|nr:glucokinase [Nitrospirota bacterium]
MTDQQVIKRSTILAADIGGTNSRFASFSSDDEGKLIMLSQSWLKTANADSFGSLINKLISTDFPLKPADTDVVGIAIAGPIENDTISSPPLIPWRIDISEIQKDLGFKKTFLINDFVAQAYACLSPVGKVAQTVLPGKAVRDATIAVIGAGTGLGKALLAPDGRGNYRALPSEGAHADFPFVTERENEFMKFLMQTAGISHVTYNHVVSGSGLSAVHRFLTGEQLTPQEVAKGFDNHPETLSWISHFYGRACRNFALETLALGGLFIAGGVAARNPIIVNHKAFKDEFYMSNTMGHLLRDIPVRLITDQNSGLWGVAVKAVMDLQGKEAYQHE